MIAGGGRFRCLRLMSGGGRTGSADDNARITSLVNLAFVASGR